MATSSPDGASGAGPWKTDRTEAGWQYRYRITDYDQAAYPWRQLLDGPDGIPGAVRWDLKDSREVEEHAEFPLWCWAKGTRAKSGDRIREIWPVVESQEEVSPDVQRPAPRTKTAPEKWDKFSLRKALHGRGLTDGEYHCLSILLDYADGDGPEKFGNARPSHGRLALAMSRQDDANGRRVVRRFISSLKSKGFLVETSPGTNNGGNRAAVYRVKLPEWK